MKCPHCLDSYHPGEYHVLNNITIWQPTSRLSFPLGGDDEGDWSLDRTYCPSCKKFTLVLQLRSEIGEAVNETLIRPKTSNRPPIPLEVPEKFAVDYLEASLVLSDSPKASAALSRRCLQLLLREKVGIQAPTLHKEIEQAKGLDTLPTHIVDLLDVPRQIGNLAAHPELDTAGIIVEIEPWEAEWCLEVIEALYDHLFVAPARNAERLNRLKQKT